LVFDLRTDYWIVKIVLLLSQLASLDSWGWRLTMRVEVQEAKGTCA
jgi:hypothetical protein